MRRWQIRIPAKGEGRGEEEELAPRGNTGSERSRDKRSQAKDNENEFILYKAANEDHDMSFSSKLSR